MNRAISIVIGLAWLVSAMHQASVAREPMPDFVKPGTSVEFTPRQLSFGVIRYGYGKDLSLDVQVKNVTANPLELRRLFIGMRWLTADLVGRADLAPGATTTIRVTLHRDRMLVGQRSTTLLAYSDKEVPGRISSDLGRMNIDCTFAPSFVCDSAELYLDEDIGTAEHPGHVRLENVDDRTHRNLRVESSSDALLASLATDGSSDGPELMVQMKTGLPAGHIDAEVRLFADGSTTPELTMPVHCRVPPPVRAVPDALLLGRVDHRGEIVRQIKLRADRPITPRLANESAVGVRLIASKQEGNIDVLSVGIPIKPDQEPGLYSTRIALEFPEFPSLKLDVPVVGEIEREPSHQP